MGVWRWSTEFAPAAYSRRARPWTADEIRIIRTSIEGGRSVAEIARELKRTEAAVRYKARLHGVALERETAVSV